EVPRPNAQAGILGLHPESGQDARPDSRRRGRVVERDRGLGGLVASQGGAAQGERYSRRENVRPQSRRERAPLCTAQRVVRQEQERGGDRALLREDGAEVEGGGTPAPRPALPVREPRG